jgi:hypothetical protein
MFFNERKDNKGGNGLEQNLKRLEDQKLLFRPILLHWRQPKKLFTFVNNTEVL